MATADSGKIVVDLDVQLAIRKMRLKTLSEITGISVQNLSLLKTGKARAIRFTTLVAICKALDCQPGDILRCDFSCSISEKAVDE